MALGTGRVGQTAVWFGLATVLVSAVAHEAPTLPSSQPIRPNVLLILADDLGTDHLSWHPVGAAAGNPAPTPELASLAAQGLVFTEAYAAPLCSPSRASLLTGRLPYRHGIGDNVVVGSLELSFDELTLAEALGGVGYDTAGFGKWHVSLGPFDPLRQGFEHYDGTISGLKYQSYYNWKRYIDGKASTETGYNTTVVTDSAVAWIRSRSTRPWFAYVAYSAPHRPYEAPPIALDPITQASPTSPENVIYHGMIEALDTEVGRLVREVDLANTLVLFLGDNGTVGGSAQPPVLPNKAKSTVYEGGVRVPAFVLGATVTATGERAGFVHLVDLFGTLLDAAQLPPPPGPIDSVSLLAPGLPPAMRWQPRRKNLFTERFDLTGTLPNGPFLSLRRSLREQRYKLIRTELSDELYDLWLDPWESYDLLQGPLSAVEQAAYAELDVRLESIVNS